MSNTNAPFGLRPVRQLSGCADISISPYTIASSEATAMALGSPVKLTGTGTNIALAAAGDTAVGVFAGVEYLNTQGEHVRSQYWPAGTVTYDGTDAQALVWDDPNIIFEIQTATLAKADVGQLADWVAGTLDTLNKRSGAYLDSSLATSGKGLRILRLADKVGNDYGAYAIAEVRFAEHTLLGVTSGAGGV